jgi:prevent-host-death family protein
MNTTINSEQFLGSLTKVVKRVRKGDQFLVTYRGKPAFRVVPMPRKQHARSKTR